MVEQVARDFGTTAVSLLSASRRVPLPLLRYTAMYILWAKYDWGKSQVARAFGVHHTVAHHGILRVAGDVNQCEYVDSFTLETTNG